jgi:hypothetical protein
MPLQCPASFVNIRKRNLLWFTSSQQLHLIKGESKPLAGRVADLSMGTPMSLSVLSLNQLKAIGCSDGLAPISRPGYSRLADFM